MHPSSVRSMPGIDLEYTLVRSEIGLTETDTEFEVETDAKRKLSKVRSGKLNGSLDVVRWCS